jgi:hypothetical protein
VKPVFLEPSEFLLPPDSHCYCCCVTASPIFNQQQAGLVLRPSETEGLVTPSPSPTTPSHHSHCSHSTTTEGGSQTGSFCSSLLRPPSVLVEGRAFEHSLTPEKFNLLARLGLTAKPNPEPRPCNV